MVSAALLLTLAMAAIEVLSWRKVIAPKHRRETSNPVLPSAEYCIVFFPVRPVFLVRELYSRVISTSIIQPVQAPEYCRIAAGQDWHTGPNGCSVPRGCRYPPRGHCP